VAVDKSVTGGCEPRCYEIRVRGPIGPTMMEAFPTLTATRSGPDTLLTGAIPDQSALYGVQLLEINRRECGGAGTIGQIT